MNRRGFLKLLGVLALTPFVRGKSEQKTDYGAFEFWDNASDEALGNYLAGHEVQEVVKQDVIDSLVVDWKVDDLGNVWHGNTMQEGGSCLDIINSRPVSASCDCGFEFVIENPCQEKTLDDKIVDSWMSKRSWWIYTDDGEYWSSTNTGEVWRVARKGRGRASHLQSIDARLESFGEWQNSPRVNEEIKKLLEMKQSLFEISVNRYNGRGSPVELA